MLLTANTTPSSMAYAVCLSQRTPARRAFAFEPFRRVSVELSRNTLAPITCGAQLSRRGYFTVGSRCWVVGLHREVAGVRVVARYYGERTRSTGYETEVSFRQFVAQRTTMTNEG